MVPLIIWDAAAGGGGGDESPAVPLLHRLLPQQLPHRTPAQGSLLSRALQADTTHRYTTVYSSVELYRQILLTGILCKSAQGSLVIRALQADTTHKFNLLFSRALQADTTQRYTLLFSRALQADTTHSPLIVN